MADGFSDETHSAPKRAAPIGPKRGCLVVVAGPRLGEIFPVEAELIIGREPDAQLRIVDDEGVSRRHARVTPHGDGALITDLGSANGLYVDGAKVNEKLLVDGNKVRIGQTTILKFTRYDEVEETAQRQLLEAALRDPLTHAFNRRYFEQRLSAEIRFAERHKQPLALLLFDVDHFREVNERVGPQEADAVLARLGALMTSSLRAEDVVARWTGATFVVLARGIQENQAAQLAERLRKSIAAAPLGTPEHPVSLTVSIGVAGLAAGGPPDGTDRLIERTQAALSRAKQHGRNQVAQ